jgi:hypothetical protein
MVSNSKARLPPTTFVHKDAKLRHFVLETHTKSSHNIKLFKKHVHDNHVNAGHHFWVCEGIMTGRKFAESIITHQEHAFSFLLLSLNTQT